MGKHYAVIRTTSGSQVIELKSHQLDPSWTEPKLDDAQRKRPLGVLYRLWRQYLPRWVMCHLGMRPLYFRVHRSLYMALHHGEKLSLREFFPYRYPLLVKS